MFDTLQAGLTDKFFTTQPVTSDVIIIDIDEESLAAIGQWPWPRSVHAELLQQVEGARAIGFDVLFTEPSGLGSQDDEALRAASAAFLGTVVLPAVIDEQSGRVTYPVAPLREESITGFVNTVPDRDGVVRSMSLKQDGLTSFATILANNESPLASILVYYHGPAKTYTTLSYHDVYKGLIPKEMFRNKTVLVGASAAGLGDTFQTPFGAMPGVEIHANAIETLRTNSTLVAVPSWVGVLLFVLIAGGVLCVLQKIRSLLQLTIVLFVTAVSIVVLSYVSFTLGFIVPHFYMLLLFVGTSGTLLLLQYLFESQEKYFIRNSFEHYVAPEVIAELYTQPEKLGLGGETRRLSILFSDIRGFTSISETLTPQQLMTQLNEYLEEMSEAVMQHKGLVDKYIGDAVMAFWGAPLPNEQHAVMACESVIAMTKALAILNQKWESEGRPAFAIGVGVSTGEVVVGNIGSKRRFNYSIIGDEVNFSARIEGLTKQYGVECIIGETTYEAIKDVPHLFTRELDDVMVKGKLVPRRIYELITTKVTATKAQALEQFALGRDQYKAGKFVSAAGFFAAALALEPEDGPSKVFHKRAEALMKEPPADWNGVFEFKTK
jgi:adenylate cyclase